MKGTTSRIRVRFTRQGVQALFIASFCLLGAVIREMNLLVILGGLVAGALAVQWRLGRRNLQSVDARHELPAEAYAGEPFSVNLEARNGDRYVSAYQVTVSEPVVQPVSVGGMQPYGSSVLSAVRPLQETTGTYICSTATRGRYTFGPLLVESAFPFGLLRCFRQLPETAETFVVFPRLLQLKYGWRSKLRRQQGGGAHAGKRAGSHEGQFFGLRAWQNGDSRRWIHWRTTARIGELAVRQFEHPRDEQLLLLVDLYQERFRDEDKVERAISAAATIVEQVTRSPMFRLALGIAGAEVVATAGTAAALVRKEGLTLLAEAAGTRTPKPDELIVALGAFAAKRWPLLVISTRPRAQGFGLKPPSGG